METSKFKFFDQFTNEQIKKQYRSNYDRLVVMMKKAKKTGMPVNGYTLSDLEILVNKYSKLI